MTVSNKTTEPNTGSTFEKDNDDSALLLNIKLAVPSIILAILAVVLSLTGGLVAFFLLQKNEYDHGYTGLTAVSEEATINFQKGIQQVIRNVQIFHGLYNVTLPDHMPRYYDQSVPFMYASGAFPEHINSVYYVKRVLESERVQFVQDMRTTGPEFRNFNITSRATGNAIIPFLPNSVYWVVLHVVPNVNINISVGFDYGTNAARNGTVYKAITTRSIAASSKVAQTRGGFGSVVLIPMFNSTNSSDCIGLAGGTVRFDTLLLSSMQQYSNNLLISLTDFNSTGSADDQFLWSTGLINGTIMNRNQTIAAMAKSPYTTTGKVIFGDRTFGVTYAPNDAFLSQYRSNDKWIALIIFLVFMIISLGACVVLFFARRLAHSMKMRKHSKRQFDIMKDNQVNLTALLRRIANQEQKTRATINAIPDYIVTITQAGKIIHFNSAFEQLYNYSEQQLAEGIFISSIFFALYQQDKEWYKNLTETAGFDTVMETKNGELPVSVMVRNLNNAVAVVATSPQDLHSQLGNQSHHENEEDEDFVIIARLKNV